MHTECVGLMSDKLNQSDQHQLSVKLTCGVPTKQEHDLDHVHVHVYGYPTPEDPLDVNSYRGITLNSAVLKVLESLILDRLEPIFMISDSGLPHLNQER